MQLIYLCVDGHDRTSHNINRGSNVKDFSFGWEVRDDVLIHMCTGSMLLPINKMYLE